MSNIRYNNDPAFRQRVHNAQQEFAQNPEALHDACQQGDLEKVKELIFILPGKINACDEYNETPLHEVSSSGDVTIARFLLDHGANIHAQTILKRTPLHEATGCGNLAVLFLLLKRGANTEARDHSEGTPLCDATEFGYTSLIRLLLDHGASALVQESQGHTPLIIAAANKCSNTSLKTLLFCSHIPDNWRASQVIHRTLNLVSPKNRCLAHIACHNLERGHLKMLPTQLRQEIETLRRLAFIRYMLSIKNNNHATVRDIANRTKNDALLALIDNILKARSLNDLQALGYGKQDPFPLHTACEQADLKKIQALITIPRTINAQDAKGQTLLHYIALSGDVDSAQFLLDNGANINAQDHSGYTPLHKAAYHGRRALTSLLLDHGAALETQEKTYGFTPLYQAIYQHHPAVIRLLLERGACATLVIKNGNYSPVHLATSHTAHHNSCDTLKMLLFYAPIVDNWQTRENVNLSNPQASLKERCLNHIACRALDRDRLETLPAELRQEIEIKRRIAYIRYMLGLKSANHGTARDVAVLTHNSHIVSFIDKVLKATLLSDLKALGYNTDKC